MAATLSEAAAEFADLAKNLTLVGSGELKQELYKAINEAARPVADEIRSLANLEEHMPNRYAAVLAADLQVTTYKNASVSNPGVTITARAPTPRHGSRGRQVQSLNAGLIRHPVFADRTAPRRTWHWKSQTGGMQPGFFTDPCEAAAPRVRDAIGAAVDRAMAKAERGA